MTDADQLDNDFRLAMQDDARSECEMDELRESVEDYHNHTDIKELRDGCWACAFLEA